jgi:hypothetical protein
MLQAKADARARYQSKLNLRDIRNCDMKYLEHCSWSTSLLYRLDFVDMLEGFTGF